MTEREWGLTTADVKTCPHGYVFLEKCDMGCNICKVCKKPLIIINHKKNKSFCENENYSYIPNYEWKSCKECGAEILSMDKAE